MGIRGENLARGVLFDVSSWMTTYGEGGGFVLRVTPHGWETFYPVILSSYSSTDKTVGWDIDSAATAVDGSGEAQLIYTIGSVIVASRTWRTYVHLSITTSETAPDPYQDWASAVSEQVATAQQSASDASVQAEAAAASAENAAEAAEAVEREIGVQVMEYVSTHQSELAEKVLEAISGTLFTVQAEEEA